MEVNIIKSFLSDAPPSVGEVIEFLKDLRLEDRAEFLFGKDSEEEAINTFINVLPYSDYYSLKLSCGKILAMGGIISTHTDDVGIAWLLCANGSEKRPVALFKAIRQVYLKAGYSHLYAEVYNQSFAHKRFIERVGFKLSKKYKDFDLYLKS